MTTDFPTAPSAYGLEGPSAPVTVEKSPSASHTEILTLPATLIKEYADLPDITCLPGQLSQVFMNLLINAVQAISDKGSITLRTGHEADIIWIEVEDTGSGIRAEDLSRIFDPFFTTKPVGSGTGLGLAISYRIVESHKGRIEVRSEVGRGTTFRVILPLRPAIVDAVR